MRRYKVIICALLFFFNLNHWAAVAKSNTVSPQQFRAALLCKAEPIDAREANIANQLKKQKIAVKDFEKNGLINLKYRFAKPLYISNVKVSAVRYQGDSGSYFYAIAKGDMAKFAESIGAKSVPRSSKETLSWGDINQYFKYTNPVTKTNPYPNIILIGRDKTSKQDEFYFGCLRFDY